MAGTQGRVWGGLTAQEREERRRAQILETGLELFATKGWTKVTVLEICRGARLSQRYFYEQFPSREDLFMAIADGIGEDVERIVRTESQAPDRSAEERVTGVLGGLADYFIADPRKVRVALVESFATEEFRVHRARVLASLSELASRLMGSLGQADPRSRDLSALIISGGIAEALIRSVTGDTTWSRDELVAHLTRLYTAAARL